MPYLTMRKNLRLQVSPGLVASYDIQSGNGVGLFWDTTHTHIFTYLLSPDHTGSRKTYCQGQCLTLVAVCGPSLWFGQLVLAVVAIMLGTWNIGSCCCQRLRAGGWGIQARDCRCEARWMPGFRAVVAGGPGGSFDLAGPLFYLAVWFAACVAAR